ncbi:hypothetical protein LSAT2_014763 [Lamellibrachia satsuma]|nr:hypothetical protein LSAT2_014763 [Lamellibrachia satsuma]
MEPWISFEIGVATRLALEMYLANSGNDILNIMTSYRSYKLRFDLEDFEGNKRFAMYSSFAYKPFATKQDGDHAAMAMQKRPREEVYRMLKQHVN